MSTHLALRMLTHATAAGVIFFLFQRYGLGASLETGLIWALTGAVAAAALAWTQSRRSQ